jgi:thioredoxin-like negative regulator of GroEL
MFEQVLNEVTPEYNDKINLYKVNIEEEPEIAGLFGVRSLPTSVTISKSGDTEPTIGAIPKDTLKYFLEGLTTKK